MRGGQLREHEARIEIDRVVGLVQRWAGLDFASFKFADKLRLARLRTWELRYYVSIHEILDILVPVFRNVLRLGEMNKAGLGVPIQLLTSRKAEEILIARLERRYPNMEHVQAWREAERDRQLRAEKAMELEGVPVREKAALTVLNFRTPEEFIQSYGSRVDKGLAERRRAGRQAWRRRRKYRNNPW